MAVPLRPGVYAGEFATEPTPVPELRYEGRSLRNLMETHDLIAAGLLQVPPVNGVNLLLAAEQELHCSLEAKTVRIDLPSCVGHGVVLGEEFHGLDYQLLAVRRGLGVPLVRSLGASVISVPGEGSYRLGYQAITISDAWAVHELSVASSMDQVWRLEIPAITVAGDGGIYWYAPHVKLGLALAKLVYLPDTESQAQLNSFIARFHSGIADVYDANQFTPTETPAQAIPPGAALPEGGRRIVDHRGQILE